MTPTWDTSCVDWGDRLREGRSIIPPPIFPEQAELALGVFKQLKIMDAAGSPTFGESCAPWVFDLVRSVFGAYDPDTGRRLITEWLVVIPKKNSKSTISAGIMMTALILNWRQSAEFAILAPTVEVASCAFSPARDMCSEKADEELFALLNTQSHIRTITHRESNATLKVLASDSSTVGGKKSVGTLIDELWLFGKVPNAENMLREAVGGLASRPEGFVIYLTTQSDDPPAGVFKQKLQYARDVRDGKIVDPGFVPIIFEHPPEMVERGEHLLLENLAMVNPNLGYSVDRQFLEREYTKAKEMGEGSFRGFMSKHGNCEIGMNLRSDRWTGADFWEAQARPRFTLDELIERSEVITVGDDGGGLDDIHGVAALGRTPDGELLLWTHGFLHPIAVERRKSLESTYAGFVRDGDLEMLNTLPDDVTRIVNLVMRIYDSGKLASIGLDPEKTHKVMYAALIEAGLDKDMVYAISQGWKLVGAITLAERWLSSGLMIHGNQPMMNWCVSNAKIELHGNAVSITKQASGVGKIDPLMAAFNAVALMALNPESRSDFTTMRVIDL